MPNVCCIVFTFATLISLSYAQEAGLPQGTCASWLVQCNSGECIYATWVCDDVRDCDDGSDEDLGICLYRPCYKYEFDCTANRDQIRDQDNFCIPLEKECDYDQDCIDGADEADCSHLPTCEEEEFLCRKEGLCLPNSLVCDHFNDCRNGDDEAVCDYPVCNEDIQFKCNNGQCIPKTGLCDGSRDCHDNSDELSNFCDAIVDCKSPTCDPKCPDSMCPCDAGKTVDVDGNCIDINECTTKPWVCDQKCMNNDGSYNCDCEADFTLQSDGRTCRHKDGEDTDAYLLFANRFEMRHMPLDGSEPPQILTKHHYHTHVLDYLYEDEDIYFVDAALQQILRVDLNATVTPFMINTLHASEIEGLAVDWVGKKLYWSSGAVDGIYVCELNGTNCMSFIKGKAPYIRGIVLHPKRGYIFFTEWSLTAFIGRVGMDGNGFTKIVETGVFWPNGITVDYPRERVYWADAGLGRIESVDLDGGNRHVVLENQDHMYALTMFEEYIFFTEWNIKQVLRANRFAGKNSAVTIFANVTQIPYDIHVVHPSRQPKSDNPCGTDNGGCSHLCLIANGGENYTCACPTHFELGDNKHTCTPACNSAQFLCGSSDHKCIPHLWVCDGENDCFGEEDEQDCDKPSVCSPGYHECDTGGKCISPRKICDGNTDCPDLSDEIGCEERECLPYEFRCNSGQCLPQSYACDDEMDCEDDSDESPINLECDRAQNCTEDEFKCTNTKCIPKLWFCDFDDDCGDASDEPKEFCKANATCRDGWESCPKNYRCIPHTSLCDGENDCRDNSDEDEEACPACGADEFACVDGKGCIPKRWHCDFAKQCEDGSDEEDCEGVYRPCTESESRCNNSRCITTHFRCDGDNDCGDWSDEDGCKTHACIGGRFQCESDSLCIWDTYKCDQRRHCQDASDEKNCEAPLADGKYCQEDKQFTCSNSTVNINYCIPNIFVCDGRNECLNGEDETPQVCLTKPCNNETHFRCKTSNRCFPLMYTCDGKDDCPDKSDESLDICAVECDPDTKFKCKEDNKCIPLENHCDEIQDCSDGSDEKPPECIQRSCSVDNGGCAHKCDETTVDGFKLVTCSCDPGYEIHREEENECVDIDECNKWSYNYCEIRCNNTKGGYKCSCMTNFQRRSGGQCSLKPDDYSGFESVIFSDGITMRQYVPTTTTGISRDLFSTQKEITSLDVSKDGTLVYWTQTGQISSVYRAAINSSWVFQSVEKQKIMIRNQNVTYVRIDWLTSNIYWADENGGKIGVAESDGNNVKTLVQSANFRPTSIALAPEAHMMFWINSHSEDKSIRSSYMNGKNRETVVDTKLDHPKSLVVDVYSNNRLYWIDGTKILSCLFDGSDWVEVFTTDERYGSIGIFGVYLYSATASNMIVKRDKFGRYDPKLKASDTSWLSLYSGDISFSHGNRYHDTVDNPCAERNCAGICVLKKPNNDASSVCMCPDIAETNDIDNTCDKDIINNNKVEVPAPKSCWCVAGTCAYQTSECTCDLGYKGKYCDTRVSTTTSTTTTTTTITTPVSTTSEYNTPKPLNGTTEPRTGKHSSPKGSAAAIAVPVILIILLIVVIVVVGVWLYRTGKLKRYYGGGQSTNAIYRPGTGPQGDTVKIGDGPSIMESAEFNEGIMGIGNPMYDTMQAKETKEANNEHTYATIEPSKTAPVDSNANGIQLNTELAEVATDDKVSFDV